VIVAASWSFASCSGYHIVRAGSFQKDCSLAAAVVAAEVDHPIHQKNLSSAAGAAAAAASDQKARLVEVAEAADFRIVHHRPALTAAVVAADSG